MRLHRVWLIVCAAVGAFGYCSPAWAVDPAAAAPSLALVPADAAVYSATLRLGEQWNRFARSKAYAALRDLPAVKHALQHIHDESEKPGSPVAEFMKAMKDPANRQLMEMLHEGLRTEIFAYGGANWGPFAKFAMELNSSNQFAPALAVIRGEDPQRAQFRNLIHALKAAGDKLQVPEIVIGIRLTKSEPALAQIQRLETLLNQVTKNTPLQGRVRREQVAGANALTLSLDGSLIPRDAAEDDEDVRELFEIVKKWTAKICVLVKGDYLLVTIGPSAAAAESFGRGPFLASRPEFAPLTKHNAGPITSITYTSAALAAALATTPDDLKSMAELAKQGLEAAPLSKDRREAILKDVQTFVGEMAAGLPKPAATMSYSFLTPRGQESFSYDYGQTSAIGDRTLKLIEHVGGSPLVAVVAAVGDPLPTYQWAVKWIGVFFQHGDAVIKEVLGDGAHEQFRSGVEMIRPLVEQFQSITAKQLLPSLGAGEIALVVDGKWTSKRWFPEVDQHGESLPMIELSALRTVADAKQLAGALAAYRDWANKVLQTARDSGAPLPEITIPATQSKALGDGTAYYWPVPQEGQDERILPNLAIAPGLVVKSLSLGQSERLLASKPLAVEGIAAPSRPVRMFAVVDVAGVVGLARPWIEKFAVPRLVAEMPPDAPPGLKPAEIPGQVRVVLDVLQCIRTVRVETYRDANATITHTELVLTDLK